MKRKRWWMVVLMGLSMLFPLRADPPSSAISSTSLGTLSPKPTSEAGLIVLTEEELQQIIEEAVAEAVKQAVFRTQLEEKPRTAAAEAERDKYKDLYGKEVDANALLRKEVMRLTAEAATSRTITWASVVLAALGWAAAFIF